MNQAETKKLLNIIAGTYAGFNPTDDSVDAWEDALGDRTFEDVRQAFSAFVRRNKKAFAPSPGEILALLPAGREETEETVEHFDGGYHITRIWAKGEAKPTRRTFMTATAAEKKQYQIDMEARGYRRVVEKRPRGYAVSYVPKAWRVA